MAQLNLLLKEAVKNSFIPPHDCSKNLKIISETHSVNSLHNIIIVRVKQCKICGEKFEESDPGGLK